MKIPWTELTIVGLGITLVTLIAQCANPAGANAKIGATVEVTDGSTWACHVLDRKAVILNEYVTMIKGRQYVIFELDRNNDGKIDMNLAYGHAGGQLHPFPTFYVFGHSGPEVAYIDAQLNGRCSDMSKIPLSDLFPEAPPSSNHEDEQCHEAVPGENDPSNPKKEM